MVIIGSTYIEFDDVVVPVQNLVGKENGGFGIIMSSTSDFTLDLCESDLCAN